MRRFRTLCAGLVLALCCMPAYSIDPITLILLRVLRDKLISAGIENVVERATLQQNTPQAQRAPRGVPFGKIDDEQLRRIVDEGFVHLSWSQRNEVYASLQLIIADPKNAADVPAIIAELTFKASATRQAYEQFNGLSFSHKRRIAAEARNEYEKMPADAREQMLSALNQRGLPMPADLQQMILTEINRVPTPIIASPAAMQMVNPVTSSTAQTTPTATMVADEK